MAVLCRPETTCSTNITFGLSFTGWNEAPIRENVSYIIKMTWQVWRLVYGDGCYVPLVPVAKMQTAAILNPEQRKCKYYQFFRGTVDNHYSPLDITYTQWSLQRMGCNAVLEPIWNGLQSVGDVAWPLKMTVSGTVPVFLYSCITHHDIAPSGFSSSLLA